MKKIIFSIVGSMLIGLCAVQAQEQDTTGMASKSRNKQNKQRYEQQRQQRDQTQRHQDQTRHQRDQAWQQQGDSRNAYANEGMVIIDKDEIPSSLKQTLQKEKYAGWENATIYHNTNTGEYVIAPRAYRFDEQGKEIEMGNTGYGGRDGNQSRYGRQNGNADRSPDRNMQEPPERTAQSSQGQDPRGETSTYSSGNQQQSNEESTTGQSSQYQEETADQSSRSQNQSDAYRSDQSGQRQRNGQQPSASYRGENDPSETNGQSQRAQSSQNYLTEDMTEVQPEQVPATLRRTLSEKQYSGWETNGKLYKDPVTNEFMLVMEKQGDASQAQTYRFDKNGQPKGDWNSSNGQNRQGRGDNGQR